MKSITVVVPTYNSIKFIQSCMRSVLAQTYEHMDILVCDNESTDGTYEYLQSIKNSKFELVSLPNIIPNGYREAIEYVFPDCQTDYVTFIASDDIVAPIYIQQCMDVLNQEENIIRCMQSAMVCIDVYNKPTGQVLSYFYHDLDEFKRMFMKRSPVTTPTVVFHRDLWELFEDGYEAHAKAGLVNLEAGDYDFWGKLANAGVFIKPISKCLGYCYKWHADQATWNIHKKSINYDKIVQLYWGRKWGFIK